MFVSLASKSIMQASKRMSCLSAHLGVLGTLSTLSFLCLNLLALRSTLGSLLCFLLPCSICRLKCLHLQALIRDSRFCQPLFRLVVCIQHCP